MTEGGYRRTFWKGGERKKNPDFFDADEFENRKSIPHKSEVSPELKEYLEKIDFTLLRSIFDEEYRAYGLDPKKMNFFEKDEIRSVTVGLAGSYDPDLNALAINAFNLFDSPPKEIEGVNMDLYITYLLTHEMSHAIGKVHESGEKVPQYAGTTTTYETGYRRYELRRPQPGVYDSSDSFNLFNEGVTDLSALETLKKYADRSGRFTQDDWNKFEEVMEKTPYWWARKLAKDFTKKLAQAAGLPEEVAWQAVRAGMFRGDSLYDGDLREYLNAELNPEYLQELSKGNLYRPPAKLSFPQKIIERVRAMALRLKRSTT